MNLDTLIEARPCRREDLRAWYPQLLKAAEDAELSIRELAGRLGCPVETL